VRPPTVGAAANFLESRSRAVKSGEFIAESPVFQSARTNQVTYTDAAGTSTISRSAESRTGLRPVGADRPDHDVRRPQDASTEPPKSD
jgi:hypothetical protein